MVELKEIFGTDSPVAVVTGSGSPRVGQAIARHLSNLGYRIAIHANSSIDQAEQFQAELETQNIESKSFQANLSQEAEALDMFDKIHWYFGRIDLLVNTAAIWEEIPFEQVKAEHVKKHFEANCLGSFICAQAAGMRMIEQSHGGSIINFGDWATCRPYLNYAHYFPSKGAVEAMTRSLAIELGKRNPQVRVNAILPGPVLIPADRGDDYRQEMLNATITKRVGEPEFVAETVAFLATNPYITGVILPVDSGRSIYAADA